MTEFEIISWRDQPLVILKAAVKGAHLNNFFSIGWILILFMVDGGLIKVLRKKGKKILLPACTNACTLFCTNGQNLPPQNFA